MFSNNLFPWFYSCNFIYILISECLHYVYLFMMHYISTINVFSLRCKLSPSFKSHCRNSQLPDANLLALHFYDKQGVQYKYSFRLLLSNIILFEQLICHILIIPRIERKPILILHMYINISVTLGLNMDG